MASSGFFKGNPSPTSIRLAQELLEDATEAMNIVLQKKSETDQAAADAAQSAFNASVAAQASDTSRAASATQAANSAASAQDAHLSAQASAASATDSSNSASQAAQSLQATIDNANAAAASKVAASVSEQNAKTSETNAKASENAAKASQNAAATSASNAASSASAALASQNAAKTSEDNALASKNAAAASATTAEGHKNAAATSASNASTSASTASTKASEASASATAAKTSETNAKASETAAKTSENNAKASENAAKTSETKAETARAYAEGYLTALSFQEAHPQSFVFPNKGVQGFSCVNGTLSQSGSGPLVVTQTGSNSDLYFVRNSLSIDGSKFTRVVIRIRRTTGSAVPQMQLYWTTASHGHGAYNGRPLVTPAFANGVWYDCVYDLRDSTKINNGSDWLTNTITGVRFDPSEGSVGDVFEVEHILFLADNPTFITTKASEAAASAADASSSASTASTKASEASTSAASALAHKNAAATSEANAAASAANAAQSAANAQTWNPQNYYSKTEADNLLAQKANLSGATFTGTVTATGAGWCFTAEHPGTDGWAGYRLVGKGGDGKQNVIYGRAGQVNIDRLSASGAWETSLLTLSSSGTLWTPNGLNTNERVRVGMGQNQSWLEMHDTDEGTRFVHNNGGSIGFVGSGGAWCFRVYNDGLSYLGSATLDGRGGWHLASDGNLYMPWAGAWLSNVLAAKYNTGAALLIDAGAGAYGLGAYNTSTSRALFGYNRSGSADDVVRSYADRTQSTGFKFYRATSDNNGAADTEWYVRGDGATFGDGPYTGTGADYAEYFEWEDGNPDNEDRRGWSVVLVDDKVRRATAADDPEDIIGVVSACPVVMGDSAQERWQDQYLRDDFGNYLRRRVQRVYWKNPDFDPYGDPDDPNNRASFVYEVDKIPEGVVPPEDAEYVWEELRILNPEYDPDRPYVPREERPEWSPIGLMGKLRMLKGEPVGPRWRKMRDISDKVEEWLVR